MAGLAKNLKERLTSNSEILAKLDNLLKMQEEQRTKQKEQLKLMRHRSKLETMRRYQAEISSGLNRKQGTSLLNLG